MSASCAAIPTRPLLKLPSVTSVLLGSFAAMRARPLDNRESPGAGAESRSTGNLSRLPCLPCLGAEAGQGRGPSSGGTQGSRLPNSQGVGQTRAPSSLAFVWPITCQLCAPRQGTYPGCFVPLYLSGLSVKWAF